MNKAPFTEAWNKWLPQARRVKVGLFSTTEPRTDFLLERVKGIAADFYWLGFKAGEQHNADGRLLDRMTERELD